MSDSEQTREPPREPVTWNRMRGAGGREAFVAAEIERRGLAVERRETEAMSKAELAAYKRALKAEAAERALLMRETWRAYLAHHIVHLGEGVFWNDDWDWDTFDHPRAEERRAENDIPPLETPGALADALGIDIPTLRWWAYHREAARTIHYERFTIPKRSGGERAIWAPRPPLKQAQRWILREIVERLPVHGAAHGFLAGRSIVTNARRHVDSEVVVKIDLQDFFPTVTLPRAKGVFRKAGYREQVATLLALLCTEAPRQIAEIAPGDLRYVALGPRCLPQGAPTSPAITNTLCLRLDARLDGLARALGWRYTRYADDLTFSAPAGAVIEGQIAKIIGATHEVVAEEGFAIHAKKTRVMRPSSRQSVTGLIVNGPGEPRVPRSTRRTLRAALHNRARGRGEDRESPAQLLGWASFVYMTDRGLGAQMLEEAKALLPVNAP